MDESWWDGLRDRLGRRGSWWRLWSKSISNGVRNDFHPFAAVYLKRIENGDDPRAAFHEVFLGS